MNGADRIAAQIMVVAYSDPDAREQIANIVQLAWLDGQLAGIAEAKKIYNDVYAAEGSRA